MERKPDLSCLGKPFKKRKHHRPDESQQVPSVPNPVQIVEPKQEEKPTVVAEVPVVQRDHSNDPPTLQRAAIPQRVQNGTEDPVLPPPVETGRSRDFRIPVGGGWRIFHRGTSESLSAVPPREATPPSVSPVSEEERHETDAQQPNSCMRQTRVMSRRTHRSPVYSDMEMRGIILYNFERGLTDEACFEEMDTAMGTERAPNLLLVQQRYAEFNAEYYFTNEEREEPEVTELPEEVTEPKKHRKSKKSKKSSKDRDEEEGSSGHRHRSETQQQQQQVRTSPRLSGRYSGGSDEAGPSHRSVEPAARPAESSAEERKARKRHEEPANNKHSDGRSSSKRKHGNGEKTTRKRSRNDTASESSNTGHHPEEGGRRKKRDVKKSRKYVEETDSSDDDMGDLVPVAKPGDVDDLDDVD